MMNYVIISCGIGEFDTLTYRDIEVPKSIRNCGLFVKLKENFLLRKIYTTDNIDEVL